VDFLGTHREGIAEITTFLGAELPLRFGLPDELYTSDGFPAPAVSLQAQRQFPPSKTPPDLEDIMSDVNGHMERTPINPVSWSIELGFDQAELIEGHQRLLVCSAQDAMDADGNPQHPGDLAAQLALSLDNLEAVLAAAGMTLANVVRLNFYATDVDELFKQFSRVNERFGDSRYATTVLGVGQLPARFLVMLEATAVD
jgi:enamine deaminase RidA (YjgF/YER057c/UK114 family)